MKKQLYLILALATIAGSSQVLAQNNAVKGSDPRGTSCVDDALHPIAGKSYNYQAAADPTGGNYTFWATKDFNFISTTGTTTSTNINTALTTTTGLLATSTNYAAANASDVVSITWSDAILSATDPATSPTFVTVHYEAVDPNCADNLKVWSIDPTLAFTVDIRNIENEAGTILDYDAAEVQCFDIVRGATFAAGTVNYNFGTQVLYFEVVAANFSATWTPTFNLTGLGNGQTATIEYTVTPPPYTGATWVPATTGVAAPPVTTIVTETNLGVSIYVRVTIANNTFQGIVSTPITLAVDGQNSAGEWDIDNGTGNLCVLTTAADQKDTAVQTLTERPEVTPVVPTPFVPGNDTN